MKITDMGFYPAYATLRIIKRHDTPTVRTVQILNSLKHIYKSTEDPFMGEVINRLKNDGFVEWVSKDDVKLTDAGKEVDLKKVYAYSVIDNNHVNNVLLALADNYPRNITVDKLIRDFGFTDRKSDLKSAIIEAADILPHMLDIYDFESDDKRLDIQQPMLGKFNKLIEYLEGGGYEDSTIEETLSEDEITASHANGILSFLVEQYDTKNRSSYDFDRLIRELGLSEGYARKIIRVLLDKGIYITTSNLCKGGEFDAISIIPQRASEIKTFLSDGGFQVLGLPKIISEQLVTNNYNYHGDYAERDIIKKGDPDEGGIWKYVKRYKELLTIVFCGFGIFRVQLY